MSENPVKEGFLLYRGIEKSMQSSQKKYFKLFRGSRVGVDRVEVLLEKDDDDGEIISLEGCQKIAKIQAHQPYTFVVVTKSEKTYLSADSTEEMNAWLSALQSVAFRFEKEKETVPSMTESIKKTTTVIADLSSEVKNLENQIRLMQSQIHELRLDLSLLHLGEAASFLCAEGFDGRTSTSKRKIVSPLKDKANQLHRTKKQKEEHSQYVHLVETLRDRRDTGCHQAKNESVAFVRKQYDIALNSIDQLFEEDDIGITKVSERIDLVTVDRLKKFKEGF